MSNIDFDFDSASQVDAETPELKPLPKLNFGKAGLKTLRYIRWEDKKPVEIDAAEFKVTPPAKRSQEVEVSIDIQEFNPELQFTYTRKLNIGDADWNKNFRAGLLKALGLKPVEKTSPEYAKQTSEALKAFVGHYWCVEDVPQARFAKAKDGDKVYNTVKPVKAFSSREACYAEWKSTYKRGDDNGAVGETVAQGETKGPGAWSLADWQGIAGDVKASYAKALVAQTGPEQLKARKALDVVAKEYEVTPDDVKAVVA